MYLRGGRAASTSNLGPAERAATATAGSPSGSTELFGANNLARCEVSKQEEMSPGTATSLIDKSSVPELGDRYSHGTDDTMAPAMQRQDST